MMKTAISTILLALTLASGVIAQTSAPPLTGAELEAFRQSVQRCWNVDADTESARVTITISFELDSDGRVIGNRVAMLGNSGGTATAIKRAFGAARSAVLRCQGAGYKLPSEKYDQWRLVEMTFNPSEMRIR